MGQVIKLEYGKSLKGYQESEGSVRVYGTNGPIGYTDEALCDTPSLIIGRKGAYRGVHYSPGPLFVIDTAFYTKSLQENLSEKFLYYWFQTIDFDDMDSGSAIPSTSRDEVHDLDILLPSPNEQEAIAEVLSSLDDKIDLLNRQNATLEVLAKAIYRDAMTSSQGWTEVPLSEVTERITDGAHKSPATFDEGMPMASVKDMTDWHIEIPGCRRISEADYAELVEMDCRPLKGDILIAKDGSYLKHVILVENDMDLVLLSSIAILRPNDSIHPMLLAIWLKLNSTINDMQYIVSGTVIPRIVLKDFRKFPFPLPPKEEQKVLVERIKPLFEKCWANNREVATLTQMRDTLLPRLMSGAARIDLGE